MIDETHYRTVWHGRMAGTDWYLCEAYFRNGLRSSTHVDSHGEVRLTTLQVGEQYRPDDPEHVRMLAQVKAEARGWVASERRADAAAEAPRSGRGKPAPKRIPGSPGIPAKYPGACIKTGEVYGVGAMIEYIEPLGWALVEDGFTAMLNKPVALGRKEDMDVPF